MMIEVSSPPEYASTTRFTWFMINHPRHLSFVLRALIQHCSSSSPRVAHTCRRLACVRLFPQRGRCGHCTPFERLEEQSEIPRCARNDTARDFFGNLQSLLRQV